MTENVTIKEGDLFLYYAIVYKCTCGITSQLRNHVQLQDQCVEHALDEIYSSYKSTTPTIECIDCGEKSDIHSKEIRRVLRCTGKGPLIN